MSDQDSWALARKQTTKNTAKRLFVALLVANSGLGLIEGVRNFRAPCDMPPDGLVASAFNYLFSRPEESARQFGLLDYGAVLPVALVTPGDLLGAQLGSNLRDATLACRRRRAFPHSGPG
jgi:hypothetical protein